MVNGNPYVSQGSSSEKLIIKGMKANSSQCPPWTEELLWKVKHTPKIKVTLREPGSFCESP